MQSTSRSASIAKLVIGLNCVAAVCFSGVCIVLKVNHEHNQIKWHNGIFMICFISSLTSAIILIALQCLTLLTDANFKDPHMDQLAEARATHNFDAQR